MDENKYILEAFIDSWDKNDSTLPTYKELLDCRSEDEVKERHGWMANLAVEKYTRLVELVSGYV